MNLLEKIERRCGWFAVPHLTLAVIAVQALAFLALTGNPELYGGMVLWADAVMAGQWWRLLTFLMLPPTQSIIFVIFAWYLLYLMGNALEDTWGTFRYNLFWLIGYLASLAAAFFVPGEVVTNTYLVGSIFLAFAFLFPDFQILLFFILPVKVKWLALITWVYYGISLAGGIGTGDWGSVAMIAAATLNFFLFFGFEVVRRMRRGHRRMQLQREAIADRNEPFHRCSVCKKTDLSDPEAEFRYAKRGDEVVCYCLEHLPEDAK